ncbi:MAG: hypothetical protein IPL09_05535 [Bacteroidetes bacterium]|nr:hypothetical protein [Bacteroidota bacterium]MBK8328929.1 hypothetical protein [Bacteroidota bacterium]MBK9480400.1 hypothetical protein [Bacteroidota bacterium]
MKNVTLSIPDGEYEFFMKLVEKFNYSNSEQITLSNEQKKILEERRSMNNTDNFLTLEEAQAKLKQKHEF